MKVRMGREIEPISSSRYPSFRYRRPSGVAGKTTRGSPDLPQEEFLRSGRLDRFPLFLRQDEAQIMIVLGLRIERPRVQERSFVKSPAAPALDALGRSSCRSLMFFHEAFGRGCLFAIHGNFLSGLFPVGDDHRWGIHAGRA